MAPLPPPPPPPPGRAGGIPAPPPPIIEEVGEIGVVTNAYDHAQQRWGVPDAFITIAIWFGVGIALSIVAVILGSIPDTGDAIPTGAWLPALLLVPPLCQLVYLRRLSRRRGAGFGADYQLRFRRYDVLTGLLLAFMAFVLAAIVLIAMSALGFDQPSAAAAELATDAGDDTGLTVWLVIFAVGGAFLIPVIEELVYRGVLWSTFEKRGVNNIVTLFVTTTIFAAIHFEPQRFFVLFGIGLAIGVGRLATGRIMASIIAHGLINTIGMIAVLAEIAGD